MGDADKGKKLFVKMCANCHPIVKGGKHNIGPNLFGIYGKEAGKAEGFTYTDAKNLTEGFIWDDKKLDMFLTNPKSVIPGTARLFHGIKNPEDRQDMIAFLKKNQ